MPRVREMKDFIINVNKQIDKSVNEIGEKKTIKLLRTQNHPLAINSKTTIHYTHLLEKVKNQMIQDVCKK
jgi:hypothetical protein